MVARFKIPEAIRKANCAGAPVTFAWSQRISSRFAFDEDLNIRMADAFDASNYRTNVSLAVCVFEWFVRRFEGVFDLTDAYLRLEAAWACAINPAYLDDTKFEKYTYGDALPPPSDNVLTVGVARIWKPLKLYLAGEIGLAGECVNLALLTHHVMTDPTAFDNWLEAALRKGATSFPREVESYDFEADFYDFRQERIVPREFFFDSDFEYTDKSAIAVLQRFLDTLNPEANPYLKNADEMKADGYNRIPYKLVDLKKG